MTNTDELLASLAADPLPTRLQGIGPAVMTRFRQSIEARASRRSLAMAGLIALTIGAGSGLVPQASASPAQPLLAVPALAPSNVLSR